MQLLLRDPLNHPQTAALQYTLMARTGPVAILLPELPRQQPSSAEQLLQASAAYSAIAAGCGAARAGAGGGARQAGVARGAEQMRAASRAAQHAILLEQPSHKF